MDPLSSVLGLVGDRWALRVVREVFVGLRRFDDIRDATGAPRTVLADRLRRLTAAGVLFTRDYQVPGSRTRSEYALTEAGFQLMTVLSALSDWGERHLGADTRSDGEPDIVYRHRGCGGRITATLQCECGEITTATGRLLAQINR